MNFKKALFKDASSCFMLGQHEKAEKLYSEFIDSCNKTVTSHAIASVSDTNTEVGPVGNLKARLAEAYNNRGQIKYLRVDFDEAIDDYSAAIGVDKNFAVAYYNRGQIHYRLARFQQGIADFKEALRHHPDFSDAEIALKTAIEDSKRTNSHQKKKDVSQEVALLLS